MPPPAAQGEPQRTDLAAELARRWGEVLAVRCEHDGALVRIACPVALLREVCAWLFGEQGFAFGSLVVEETAAPEWLLTYLFYAAQRQARVELRRPMDATTVPSVSDVVHPADWHEREVEDLFGLAFEGHPRLGDFVLHEEWPEGVNPMRRGFDPRPELALREPDPEWRAPAILEAPGAFTMPVGPVYSDFAESAHFLLETVGEDVVVTEPRFFYKYRGVEKTAEGQSAADALLLAERFSGSSAFAHGLAYCQAVEAIAGIAVAPRALALRTVCAELERLRHHAATIAGICSSTALAVAASQAALIEEELLRVSGSCFGHRYLFGLVQPGGLSRDLDDDAARGLVREVGALRARLRALEELLRYTSSFLDRLEEVGVVSRERARSFGLVGPVARASGIGRDCRRMLPYAAYAQHPPEVPVETEGDGYARLRVLFREAAISVRLIRETLFRLPAPQPPAPPPRSRPGAAVGAVEAPTGAALHWLRLDAQARVLRWRVAPPSFANWHGFHLAAENFAFQDFPIIMASFGLSNAECDR